MKAFVTGAKGQLGFDLVNELTKRGHIAVGSDLGDLDITDREAVLKRISEEQPDVIFHCAAWTNVDGAEDENNKPKVYAVNVNGTENMVAAAKSVSAKIIHISTDYIFNGLGTEPWSEESTDYNPTSYYGETKLLAEKAVRAYEKAFIVRIAWAFGINGNNFVKTMLKVGRAHDSVNVVNDQFGTPTYTYDLARLLVDMAETEKYGVYHATNEGGYINWYEFVVEIYRQAGLNTVINSVTTEEYGLSVAKRPYNSRLNRTKLVDMGFVPLPDWKDALSRYLKELENV